MTQEELNILKGMPVRDRIRKYLPKLQANEITRKQYDFLTTIGIQDTYSTVAEGDTAMGAESRPGTMERRESNVLGRAENSLCKTGTCEVAQQARSSDEIFETRCKTFPGVTNACSGTSAGIHRDATQKERLKNFLSDGQWHDTNEIRERVYGRENLLGARIAARIYELKKDGCEIEKKRAYGKIFAYRLITLKEKITSVIMNMGSG